MLGFAHHNCTAARAAKAPPQLAANYDQSRSGRIGHGGSDGSTPFSPIERCVTTNGAGENIQYGLYDPRDIVVELQCVLRASSGKKNRRYGQRSATPALSPTPCQSTASRGDTDSHRRHAHLWQLCL